MPDEREPTPRIEPDPAALYALGRRHMKSDPDLARDAMAFGLLLEGILSARETRRVVERRRWD
jgi:hypothetical protein